MPQWLPVRRRQLSSALSSGGTKRQLCACVLRWETVWEPWQALGSKRQDEPWHHKFTFLQWLEKRGAQTLHRGSSGRLLCCSFHLCSLQDPHCPPQLCTGPAPLPPCPLPLHEGLCLQLHFHGALLTLLTVSLPQALPRSPTLPPLTLPSTSAASLPSPEGSLFI